MITLNEVVVGPYHDNTHTHTGYQYSFLVPLVEARCNFWTQVLRENSSIWLGSLWGGYTGNLE